MAKIASLVKCPVLLSDSPEDASMLICNETFALPAKNDRSAGSGSSSILLKIFVSDAKQAECFCEELALKQLPVSALSLYKQKKMKVFPEESLRGSVVEIEMPEEFKCEVLRLAGKVLGEVSFESLRKI